MLNPDDSYNASLNVELSPSAVGQYFVVYTDAPQPGRRYPVQHRQGGRRDQQPDGRRHERHAGAGGPGGHQRLDPDGELFRREDDVQLHGRERGPEPGLGGHGLLDRLHLGLSADPTFIRIRASFLGQTTHVQDQPLQPGESYTVTYTVTLPAGTGGQYYLYIDLDAHNDLPPAFTSTRRGWRRPTGGRRTRATIPTGWASSTTGRSRTRTTTASPRRSTSPTASPTSR